MAYETTHTPHPSATGRAGSPARGATGRPAGSAMSAGSGAGTGTGAGTGAGEAGSTAGRTPLSDRAAAARRVAVERTAELRARALAAADRTAERMPDFRPAGIFTAGLAVGALLGAGLALLMAPQSGEVTRAMITRRARDLKWNATDAWDDLGEELRAATRRQRRNLRRKVRQARWAAADAME